MQQREKCSTQERNLHLNKKFYFFFFFFFFLPCSWAAPAAYGGSQARGPTGAVAASLCQSHSNAGSEPCLRCTPQLTATPDPKPTEQGQGPNPQPHGSKSDSLATEPRLELPKNFTFLLKQQHIWWKSVRDRLWKVNKATWMYIRPAITLWGFTNTSFSHMKIKCRHHKILRIKIKLKKIMKIICNHATENSHPS